MPKDREKGWVEQCGARLLAAREALGMAQGAFAESINVQQTTYARWEKGERLVDPAAVVRMKERYGITLDYIFQGDLSGMPFSLGKSLERRAS